MKSKKSNKIEQKKNKSTKNQSDIDFLDIRIQIIFMLIGSFE